MFGPSVPLLHNGRWTIYAQRVGLHIRLSLIGEPVPAIPEQRDAAGRVLVPAAKALPAVIEEHSGTPADAFSGFANKDHPFNIRQIKAELALLPGPREFVAAEVTQ